MKKFRVANGSELFYPEIITFSHDTVSFQTEHGYLSFPIGNTDQFTGLKDKNGKDIYESDILKVVYGSEKVVIKYTGGQFVGINLDKEHPIKETQNRNWLQWEIIGNIHQYEK